MKHSQSTLDAGGHKPGCRCALCLGEFERRKAAATQFYSLVNMRWVGIRAAVAYAEFARREIEEAFPQQARVALAHLRKHNGELLESLLADILD